MDDKAQEVSKRLMGKSYDQLGENERRIAHHVAARTHISRDIAKDYAERLTLGQRLADRVATFGGSWTFILIFLAVLVVWVVLNSYVLVQMGKPFDPFPYILLNLFLSMLAAIQAPIILMSQNRQSHKDRLTAEHDYEVNLKAELEIMALHQKMDSLRENQWSDLISIQQEQLRLLTRMLEDSRQK
jgi:uncharacterized membrane protein